MYEMTKRFACGLVCLLPLSCVVAQPRKGVVVSFPLVTTERLYLSWVQASLPDCWFVVLLLTLPKEWVRRKAC